MNDLKHPATVVALVALFVALGGTTYAATSLPRNSVGTKQLRKNAVTGRKIKAGAVTGAKVAADSLTGADILESSLGVVPSASNATHATSANSAAPKGPAGGDLAGGTYPNPTIAAQAVTGAKVANDTLGGTQINEASLDYGGAGCKLGLIHSFARIRGSVSMPSTYTTSSTYVDFVHNCGGGTTEVRRAGVGTYDIRFNGDPAALAMAVSNFDETCPADGTGADDVISIGKNAGGGDAGAFLIEDVRNGTLSFEDGCITVVTF